MTESPDVPDYNDLYSWLAPRREDFADSVRFAQQCPTGRILDLGVGDGRVAVALAASGRCVTLVRPTRRVLERVAPRGAMADTSDNLDPVEADPRGPLDCLPLSWFSVVLCDHDVITRLPVDLDGFFIKIAGLLEEGGKARIECLGAHQDDAVDGQHTAGQPLVAMSVGPIAGRPDSERVTLTAVTGDGTPLEHVFERRRWAQHELLDAASRASLTPRVESQGDDWVLVVEKTAPNTP